MLEGLSRSAVASTQGQVEDFHPARGGRRDLEFDQVLSPAVEIHSAGVVSEALPVGELEFPDLRHHARHRNEGDTTGGAALDLELVDGSVAQERELGQHVAFERLHVHDVLEEARHRRGWRLAGAGSSCNSLLVP